MPATCYNAEQAKHLHVGVARCKMPKDTKDKLTGTVAVTESPNDDAGDAGDDGEPPYLSALL
jgi:hypothetical protein